MFGGSTSGSRLPRGGLKILGFRVLHIWVYHNGLGLKSAWGVGFRVLPQGSLKFGFKSAWGLAFIVLPYMPLEYGRNDFVMKHMFCLP